MPVTWHFLVRQLSASSIGMISLGLYSILCRTYWSITYVHRGYKGWRGYSTSYCAGLKTLSLCLDLFCLRQGPPLFFQSHYWCWPLPYLFPVDCFFLLSFDLIAGLVTWGVGCFQLLLYTLYIFLFVPTGIVLLSFYMLWTLLCDADRACFCLSLILQPIDVFIVLLWNYTCSCFPCF